MSDDLTEVVLKFANKISPANWHCFSDHRQFKYRPGILNVQIEIIDDECVDEGEEFLGQIKGPMFFYSISFFKNVCPEAMAALEKYGDGSISISKMQLCSYWGGLWREIVIHEFAHIAEDRFRARKQRAFRPGQLYVDKTKEEFEEQHGELFLRAYARMIQRSEAACGKDFKSADSWRHYCFYADRLNPEPNIRKNPLLRVVPTRYRLKWRRMTRGTR